MMGDGRFCVVGSFSCVLFIWVVIDLPDGVT